MNQDAINALVGELTVLRGLLQHHDIRLRAIEQTLLSHPTLSTVYPLQLADSEQAPKSMYPLIGLEGLRQALLGDQ